MAHRPVDDGPPVDLRKRSSPADLAEETVDLPKVDVTKNVAGAVIAAVDPATPAVGRVRGAVAAIPMQIRKVPAQLQKVPVQIQKTVADVVRLLAAVIERLRLPLLLLVLAPVPPALVLVIASAVRGGSDVPLAFVLAGIGLVPSGWLAGRRHQMLNALQPPAQAAAEMYAAVGSPDIWGQVRANLGLLVDRSEKLRLRSLSRRLWRGVRVGFDLKNRVADSPRFAPFLPARLRGLAFLAGWCLLSCVVLTLLAAVKLLASSVGIG